MNSLPEGNAIIYCQGAFGTPNGKTAHGLVRRTKRYHVLSVIDSRHAGGDAGFILDGTPKGIPIYGDIQEALGAIRSDGNNATYFVIGLAPDGGRLSQRDRRDVIEAIRCSLNVDSGLHDFLTEDSEIINLALSLCYSYSYADGKYRLSIPIIVGFGALLIGLTILGGSILGYRMKRRKLLVADGNHEEMA